jgi:hypothetical protein
MRDDPAIVTGDVLVAVRRRVECAVADGAPEQLKRLLDTVVDQILVESRACIQPYVVAPAVRTRIGQRRRTGIEPASRLSTGSSVLKTVGPTRNPDASEATR